MIVVALVVTVLLQRSEAAPLALAAAAAS